MITEVPEIREQLVALLKEYLGPLRVRKETYENFEVCGTIEAMQGKQKVDGYYFASVVPKAKDVRLYFFPVYTHKEQIGSLSDSWQKALKGKSCFHVKKLDENMIRELKDLIGRSVALYQADGLI